MFTFPLAVTVCVMSLEMEPALGDRVMSYADVNISFTELPTQFVFQHDCCQSLLFFYTQFWADSTDLISPNTSMTISFFLCFH